MYKYIDLPLMFAMLNLFNMNLERATAKLMVDGIFYIVQEDFINIIFR